MRAICGSAIFAAAAFVAVECIAAGAEIPALREVSDTVAASRPDLARDRASLSRERDALRARTERHDAACTAVEEGSAAAATCATNAGELRALIRDHLRRSAAFNDTVRAEEVIGGLVRFALRERWDRDEVVRLERALRGLATFGVPVDAAPERINAIWQEIRDRPSAEFARLAASGEGPPLQLAGAGRQSFEDCTLFALANATGIPYSVVAARAGELIRSADWRPAADRANPQRVMERFGLMGGEVIALAEGFGRAEVVRRDQLAQVLREGVPITVGLRRAGGIHQVVLSRTFRHGGETWFEVMDSSLPPAERRYVSAEELRVLMTDAVAFRPDPGRTPRLLR